MNDDGYMLKDTGHGPRKKGAPIPGLPSLIYISIKIRCIFYFV